MKPIDQRDSYLQKRFESTESHKDQEVRENRRIWKKERARYLRRKGKQEIEEMRL